MKIVVYVVIHNFQKINYCNIEKLSLLFAAEG